MIIEIKDIEFEVLNESFCIEEFFQKINNILTENRLQFEYLKIDGIDVSKNIDHYISNHLKEIQKIEVVCHTLKELIYDILLESFNYLKNGLPIIRELSNKFYLDPKDAEWTTLADLFEGLQWLNNTMQKVSILDENQKVFENNTNVWDNYVLSLKKIESVLPELQEAIENGDYVLIGDLLMYEILSGFEEASNELRFLIPNMGDGYVS